LAGEVDPLAAAAAAMIKKVEMPASKASSHHPTTLRSTRQTSTAFFTRSSLGRSRSSRSHSKTSTFKFPPPASQHNTVFAANVVNGLSAKVYAQRFYNLQQIDNKLNFLKRV